MKQLNMQKRLAYWIVWGASWETQVKFRTPKLFLQTYDTMTHAHVRVAEQKRTTMLKSSSESLKPIKQSSVFHQMDHKRNINTGLASVFSQLTGHLFLENVKMEKQRTNLSYYNIVKKFSYNSKYYFNGLYPYGLLQSFGKGFIVSSTKLFVEPKLNYSKNTNHLILGFTTGIAEACFLSPLLSIRNQLNEKAIDKQHANIMFKPKEIFKGVNALMIKRSLDWSSRYIIIDQVKAHSPIDNNLVNTFVGSGLSTIISTPADRLLPLIYSNQSLVDKIREQKLSFFYKGFVLRFISTGYYTCCLFILPGILDKYTTSLLKKT